MLTLPLSRIRPSESQVPKDNSALDEDKDNAPPLEAIDAEAATVQDPSVTQSGAPSHSALVEKNKDKRSL